MLGLPRRILHDLLEHLAPFMMSLMLMSLSLLSQAAPAGDILEYSVKGAYLFKFGSFVEWPAEAFSSADSPLKIGVLGEDPFGTLLDQITQGRMVNGRPIAVRRFRRGEAIRDIHILFISQSEKTYLETITKDLHGVLTIGEFELAQPGVMINFLLDSNKVRFDIDLEPANRAGIKLSSKLLSVARSVKGNTQ